MEPHGVCMYERRSFQLSSPSSRSWSPPHVYVICNMYAVLTYACICVRACACVYTRRVFIRCPSGHPLTVNNERGTYGRCVGATAIIQGVSNANSRLPRIEARLTFALKERSKRANWTREERRRADEEGRLVTLVLERLKDDYGEVGLWQTCVARGAFNSISSGHSEIRKTPI